MSLGGYSVGSHRTGVLSDIINYLQDKLRITDEIEPEERQMWFLRCVEQYISGKDTQMLLLHRTLLAFHMVYCLPFLTLTFKKRSKYREGLWRIIRIAGSLLYRRLLKYLDLFPCKTKAERKWESLPWRVNITKK